MRRERQLFGRLRCNLWQLRCGRNPCDCPRSCRSHLDRPPKLRWVRSSLDSDCWMCSSHIRPVHQDTNCKNIYRMRHCLDWETVVVFECALLSIFFPFLLPFLTLEISVAEWIFSMSYCSLPSVRNWKYAAYRGTSHVTAVDDDAGKEDTAIRCGLKLDGDWWKATWSDFQTNTMTSLRRLRYNKLSWSGPEEDFGKWKMTHQILVQTYTKSTLRPSRIWTHCSKIKYCVTLDASTVGEVCDYPSCVTKKLSYLMIAPVTYLRTLRQYEVYSGLLW
jgi:hypothetical protein